MYILFFFTIRLPITKQNTYAIGEDLEKQALPSITQRSESGTVFRKDNLTIFIKSTNTFTI